MRKTSFRTIYGVDFSGAKQAGRNIWIARAEFQRPHRLRGGRSTRTTSTSLNQDGDPSPPRNSRLPLRRAAASRTDGPPLRLVELSRLEDLCGCADREVALAHLVRLIRGSEGALWAMDFPFGFPIEVLPEGARWAAQFDFLREWGEDAYGLGVECLRRAKALGGPMHIRRLTDDEAKAPFDCYHYRMIYQTCHPLDNGNH